MIGLWLTYTLHADKTMAGGGDDLAVGIGLCIVGFWLACWALFGGSR